MALKMPSFEHRIRIALRRWPVAAAVASIVTLSATTARADDWPTPGLDAAHARLSAERSGAAFADGRWSWAASTSARVLASPVVSDGLVVSASLDGTVTALRADTGQLAWQAAAGSSVQGTPAIASGRVFVPTLGNKIVAFGLGDGALLWTTNLGGMTLSSPAPVNGDIVLGVGLPQRTLVRLSGATGAVVWQSPAILQQFSNTSPAIAGGLVVVGTNGGHYYAFDVATGAARWDYQADGLVHLAAPLIASGHVYMAGGDDSDHLHAVDAATGASLPGWPVSLPAPEPDLAGTLLARHRAVSSFAATGGVLVIETRLDDALDTDDDGVADQVLSRETLVAVDPTSGAIAWQHPLARVVFGDINDVPKFFICPTPAAYQTAAGASLVVASSLAATVSIIDAVSGDDAGDLSSAGRALASPVLSNGRLITVAENGTIEGRLSSVNHPPAAPILAANPRPLDAADVTLRWLPAVDPDAEVPTYELRIDTDGELLETFQQQLFPGQGATSIQLTAPLLTGVTYTYAVRARDPEGAMSPWSAMETFTVVASGGVTVDGTPAANLSAAVAAAQPGAVILLGAGTYPLSATLQVGAGVTMTGAGAGRTILDATGLAVGVSFNATAAGHPAGLDKVTLTGAATCVAVDSGATGIQLSHLVVHDCATAGIAVQAGGAANVVNATLVGNGTGLDAAGSATIKNSLLTANAAALVRAADGALVSTYDDLFGNQADYQGLAAGSGDLGAAVTFSDFGGHDFRLSGTQPSTDKGDPTDDVGSEPAPNGARVNLGAYGGTADAELSAASAAVGDPTGTPTPTPTATSPSAADGAGGCGVGGGPPDGGAALPVCLGLLLSLARRSRRRRTPP